MRIETTRGAIVVAVHRDWAPHGANRFHESATHDKEPFVVFGEVVEGMEVADTWYAEYGEAAGGGIRAGKQDPVFAGVNAYLKANFPLLDYITRARAFRP